jgi:hypothetical protein
VSLLLLDLVDDLNSMDDLELDLDPMWVIEEGSEEEKEEEEEEEEEEVEPMPIRKRSRK